MRCPHNMQVLLSDEAKRVAQRRGHAPVSPGPDESPGASGGDAAQKPWRVSGGPAAMRASWPSVNLVAGWQLVTVHASWHEPHALQPLPRLYRPCWAA